MWAVPTLGRWFWAVYESRLSHHSMASLSHRSRFSIPHPQPIPSPSVLSLVEKNPETSEAFIKQWSEDLIVATSFLPCLLWLSCLESTGDGA